ncbi:hypothetical protein [Streptomyces atriruber]|uniref:hypothetical protein n=1 Tax=Streptomyces atriruber TaxID=545121 RepID=UPI000A78D9F5|nr:hypothetical protein [Streptomyces atriruber]
MKCEPDRVYGAFNPRCRRRAPRPGRRRLTTFALVSAAVLALVQCGGGSSGDDAGDGPGSRDHGNLTELVGAYTAGFHADSGYRRPSRADRRTVAEGVGLLLDGRRSRAERRLSDVDLTVRTVTDRAAGRRYAEIADRSEDGTAPRGWGRVYIDLDAPVRWSVQVPHPVADRNTERLGAELMRRSPGGVLVLAGAHRDAGRGDAADVAHRKDTVFHAVCDELVRRGLPGLQLHGMTDDAAPEHDVVASTGRGREAVTEGRALADALRKRDYDVCRAWARPCPLEGRDNTQGRSAAAHDVPFLHIEFGPRLRERRGDVKSVVGALATVTRTWQRS